MKKIIVLFTLFIGSLISLESFSHPDISDQDNVAHYLGNEAVLVQAQKTKVLFDPFFHKNFGIYQFVPEQIRNDIYAGAPPYDNIDVIIISHAHEDHFSARDVVNYLSAFPKTSLIAPQQAVEKLMQHKPSEAIQNRIFSIELDLGSPVWRQELMGIQIEAVRIPHAGWPGRADVENLVYRVRLDSSAVVMHMGDADPQLEHYETHKVHWQAMTTQLGFPPYWFLTGAEGRYILYKTLNIEQAVGVHVPFLVPQNLLNSGQDFFSQPGETKRF